MGDENQVTAESGIHGLVRSIHPNADDETDITQSASIQESTEELADGGTVQRHVTTTQHYRPVTELIVGSDGVTAKAEGRQVLRVEVYETFTHLPPGVTETEGDGLKSESTVNVFDETLPDGTWCRHTVKKIVVRQVTHDEDDGGDEITQNAQRPDEHPKMPSTMQKLDPFSFPVDPSIAFHNIADDERGGGSGPEETRSEEDEQKQEPEEVEEPVEEGYNY